jgi:acyl carrier protein
MGMSTPSAESIRATLRDFILSNFLFTDDQAALNDTDSFQDTRIIDSMGMIQVIQFIEGEYRLKVLDAEMVPEKLDSVDRLTRFVLGKQGHA